MALTDKAARQRFGAWLSSHLDAPVAVVSARAPGGAGGWSNETLVVALDDGNRVVARLKPDGPAMFRDYDLSKEFRVLEALSRHGRPPVPRAIALDAAGAVLGRPLFVMGHVEGRIPSDNKPAFAEAGWLFEASPAEQRTFCSSMIAAMADIHAVDWRGLGLDFLAPASGTALHAEIARLESLHAWGAADQRHPTIDRGFAATWRDLPATDEARLSWGDARPANVIAAGFEPAALLDWELACVGPPELDVAWFLEMNRMRTTASGVAPLPGFLDDAETAAFYGQVAGHALGDLGWYRLHAALKVAVLMERHLRVAIARGHLPADHRLLTDNVALRRLDELLR